MVPPAPSAESIAGLVGQRASVYEATGSEGDIAVVIRFGVNKNQLAHSGVSKLGETYETRDSAVHGKPCGGHDAGSNLALGLLFSFLGFSFALVFNF